MVPRYSVRLIRWQIRHRASSVTVNSKNTLNGVLVVDYHADTIRQQAWRSAALFALAGAIVLALTLFTLWRLLRKRVIEPLRGTR